MLRITEYVDKAIRRETKKPFPGVILIWNLTNACNLSCAHCYASSGTPSDDELDLEDIRSIVPQLKEQDVRYVILSGGEPLLRNDIFEISDLLRDHGIRTYLSTNGMLVEERGADQIKKHFDYAGVSIDGVPSVHNRFRGGDGAYETALDAINRLLSAGMNVGLRFTLTRRTRDSLTHIFELAEREDIPKIYVSHLVYAGRGGRLQALNQNEYEECMNYILEKAFEYVEESRDIRIVTGNNEADAVALYRAFRRRYPHRARWLHDILQNWGGNQAGERLVNIDHKGRVKPDPFYPETLGRLPEEDFGDIWTNHPQLQALRNRTSRLEGKCGTCRFHGLCRGNSRVRAGAVHDSYWAEDPYCHLERTQKNNDRRSRERTVRSGTTS